LKEMRIVPAIYALEGSSSSGSDHLGL